MKKEQLNEALAVQQRIDEGIRELEDLEEKGKMEEQKLNEAVEQAKKALEKAENELKEGKRKIQQAVLQGKQLFAHKAAELKAKSAYKTRDEIEELTEELTAVVGQFARVSFLSQLRH